MQIGGFQKLSLIDYPGKMAAVIFTQGCNFRCGYCHNPELVNPDFFIKSIAPQEVLLFLEKRGKELEAAVITGGEPLLQEELGDFLKKIKELGYLIKLDTNGSFPEKLKNLIKKKLVDYLAMDIKAPLERYPEIARLIVNTEKIKESVNLIMNSGLNYEFRTTVVESQLRREDILKIGKMFRCGSRYVLQKFAPSKTLDREFLKEKSYSERELAEMAEELKKTYNLNCLIR